MAIVRIPSPLRKYTGGQAKVTIPGATVAEVMTNLAAAHPGIAPRIQNDDGSIKRFINVFVNEDEIRALNGDATTVSDMDEISIIPAMAGGK